MPAMKAVERPDESCPVCKQSTYLNPNMKFKINPLCYHRMCDSCIDRIFSAGPAPCPVATCKKTLRKAKFRTQTFADLTIERECDIRRRVHDVLNKREEDFESLRAYNDYAEKKEELCWKLIHDEDIESVNKQLDNFARDNKESIAQNKKIEEWEKEQAALNEEDRVKRAERGREEMMQELADERAARGQQAKGVVESIMGASGDPEVAARQARERAAQQKSSAARKDRTESQVQADARRQEAGAFGTMEENKEAARQQRAGLSFAGMRKKEAKEAEAPYDAFSGMRLETKHYTFRSDGNYRNNFVEEAKGDIVKLAGGYHATDYFRRALFDAHAGLGVVLSKEKAQPVT